MKTFLALTLTLVLTATVLVGCGCTNQNMDTTSAPTVLPTNEEIWNSTGTTTHNTTESSTATETTDAATGTDSTDATRGVNETEVQNHVNAHTEMMDEIREKERTAAPEGTTESKNSRMMPGTR